MTELVLRGVRRTHPGAARPAVDAVDLDVEAGQVLVLVGPSGSGKSTILRLVAGLDAPDAGTITLGGRDLGKVPPRDRDVAMVFQGYALYPHMTVLENIAFPLKMRGLAKTERDTRAREVATKLGLGELVGRLPAALSGGERQRVAMGRALVRDPKLFLFDEPLSNLDAALRTSLRVELARVLRELGKAAVYVTHDQTEAMTVGHRIAVMRDGKVEQVGAPRAIYEEPATVFVAGFLGSPSINLIEAHAKAGKVELFDRLLETPERIDGKVTIGIRPEHLRVRSEDDSSGSEMLSWVVRVALTEPLGGETVLHREGIGEGEPTTFRAKVPGFFDASLSDRVRLEVPIEHLHCFDGKTGRRLVERRER